MATIVSGDLSFDELQKIRRDNVGYRWDTSLVKVKLYIEATAAVLTWAVQETQHAGESIKVDTVTIKEQLDKAIAWYEARTAASANPTVYQPADNWRCE